MDDKDYIIMISLRFRSVYTKAQYEHTFYIH